MSEEIITNLRDAVINGKMKDAAAAAQRALDEGVDPLAAINDGLVAGMSIVGEKFAAHKVYLPQVLVAAKTMYQGLDLLLPAIPKSELADKKKCCVAVVEGDVHDIGKNIVKTMMTASGYEAIDVGKDMPTEKIIAAVEENNADVLAMSTLMTTTMEGMKKAIDVLKENGERDGLKVCIGGPPTSPAYAAEIGADHRDNNAQDCVNWLKEVL